MKAAVVVVVLHGRWSPATSGETSRNPTSSDRSPLGSTAQPTKPRPQVNQVDPWHSLTQLEQCCHAIHHQARQLPCQWGFPTSPTPMYPHPTTMRQVLAKSRCNMCSKQCLPGTCHHKQDIHRHRHTCNYVRPAYQPRMTAPSPASTHSRSTQPGAIAGNRLLTLNCVAPHAVSTQLLRERQRGWSILTIKACVRC